MALKDYEHHNEDAKWMWWQEEGRFEADQEPQNDPYLEERDYLDEIERGENGDDD